MDVMDMIQNAQNLAFRQGWDEMIDRLEEIKNKLDKDGY